MASLTTDPVAAAGRGRWDAYARHVPLVLIVDDEPVILRLLEINFRAAGFGVRTAGSGAGALEAAAERAPDVVVLDLGLPDLDGRDVLRRLRGIDGLASIPVVVVSGADADAVGEPGYAADVEAVLTKPVEPTELVETVRRVVRRDA